jgi:hypothetical protein
MIYKIIYLIHRGSTNDDQVKAELLQNEHSISIKSSSNHDSRYIQLHLFMSTEAIT